jgi:hypothetical protein
MFDYQTIEQLKMNKHFEYTADHFSNNNELVYEIDKEWNYLTLYFLNNKIHKIRLTFRLE